MSREIKFRAFCPKYNQWVYGATFAPIDNSLFYTVDDEVYIDPETIGQYTGIKDKNGVEIYEGDIVESFELHTEYEDYDVFPPYSSKMEQHEVRRNISAVTFEYGTFCAFEWPLGFDSFISEGRYPDDLREIFDALWEDDCGGIQEEYPNLTWQDFGKIRVIGNVHDNPELLTKGDEK